MAFPPAFKPNSYGLPNTWGAAQQWRFLGKSKDNTGSWLAFSVLFRTSPPNRDLCLFISYIFLLRTFSTICPPIKFILPGQRSDSGFCSCWAWLKVYYSLGMKINAGDVWLCKVCSAANLVVFVSLYHYKSCIFGEISSSLIDICINLMFSLLKCCLNFLEKLSIILKSIKKDGDSLVKGRFSWDKTFLSLGIIWVCMKSLGEGGKPFAARSRCPLTVDTLCL